MKDASTEIKGWLKTSEETMETIVGLIEYIRKYW